MGASVGDVFDVGEFRSLNLGRGRDQALLALADAATAIARGDEVAAVQSMVTLVESGGLLDPVVRGELRRCVGLSYVLSAPVAAMVDEAPLGPTLAVRRDLARLFVDLRAEVPVDWTALPTPPMVLTSFPLPWSAELAGHLAAAGRPEAGELASYLVEFCGQRAVDAIHRLATHRAFTDATVTALLNDAPSLPSAPLTITACGPLLVTSSDGVRLDGFTRQRVRELLGLLLLRDTVRRQEAASLLWPGLDPDRARTNLRLTLTYLRQALEPSRTGKRPSVYLRAEGEMLRLVRTDYLVVDVWQIRSALTRGRELARRGQLDRAHHAYEEALGAWTGPVLEDLRHLPELGAEVTHFDLELARAVTELAESYLAADRTADARSVAHRLLLHDPYDERSHAVVIRSLAEEGAVVDAGAALRRCEAALGELGVRPGPAITRLGERLG